MFYLGEVSCSLNRTPQTPLSTITRSTGHEAGCKPVLLNMPNCCEKVTVNEY